MSGLFLYLKAYMAVPNLKYSIGNSASTTASASISNSDTSISLTSDTNFSAKSGEGMILIDEGLATEELAYSASKAGATLSIPLVNRGLEGGSAQAHSASSTVKGTLTADMWNDVIDHLKTQHNDDGTHKVASIVSAVAPGTSGNVLTSNGSSWVSSAAAGGMTDGGTYMKPSTDGDELRAYHSDGTAYIEIGNDGTDSKITSGTGHLVLTVPASKLVKTAVLRQDNTTNTYKNNSVILTGWGYIEGNGSGLISKAVTFGITFSEAPVVSVGIAGAATAGAPSAITDLALNPQAAANVHNASNYGISTTGFTAAIARQSGNMSAGTYFGFTWTAIGVL